MSRIFKIALLIIFLLTASVSAADIYLVDQDRNGKIDIKDALAYMQSVAELRQTNTTLAHVIAVLQINAGMDIAFLHNTAPTISAKIGDTELSLFETKPDLSNPTDVSAVTAGDNTAINLDATINDPDAGQTVQYTIFELHPDNTEDELKSGNFNDGAGSPSVSFTPAAFEENVPLSEQPKLDGYRVFKITATDDQGAETIRYIVVKVEQSEKAYSQSFSPVPGMDMGQTLKNPLNSADMPSNYYDMTEEDREGFILNQDHYLRISFGDEDVGPKKVVTKVLGEPTDPRVPAFETTITITPTLYEGCADDYQHMRSADDMDLGGKKGYVYIGFGFMDIDPIITGSEKLLPVSWDDIDCADVDKDTSQQPTAIVSPNGNAVGVKVPVISQDSGTKYTVTLKSLQYVNGTELVGNNIVYEGEYLQ